MPPRGVMAPETIFLRKRVAALLSRSTRKLAKPSVPLGVPRQAGDRRGRLLPVGSGNPLLLDLAPDEACRAVPLPETRWALTPPFHPHPYAALRPRAGSLFSVALSVDRPVGNGHPVVNRHHSRGSPDFPRSFRPEGPPKLRACLRCRRGWHRRPSRPGRS